MGPAGAIGMTLGIEGSPELGPSVPNPSARCTVSFRQGCVTG